MLLKARLKGLGDNTISDVKLDDLKSEKKLNIFLGNLGLGEGVWVSSVQTK